MTERRLDYPLVSRLLGRSLGIGAQELECAFRPATAADLEELVRLRESHRLTPHGARDREYVTWRYDLSGTDPGRSIWIFRHRGEIAGTLGVERDTFSHRGCDVTIHKLMDILAREDRMGMGLGVWMNLRLQELFENTLCLGSTVHSHSIVTRLYDPLPDWETWRCPIRLEPRRARIPGLDRLLRIQRSTLRLLVDPASQLREDRAGLSATATLRSSMSTSRIMPSRGEKQAEWRFDRHPDHAYAHFALMRRNVCVAHVTISRTGSRAELSDALVFEEASATDSTKTLADLLTLVIDVLASEGIHVVSTRVNDARTASALRRAGFIRRPEPCALGCRFKSPLLAGWMKDGVPLFLMPADSDF